jgi:hypothetical protein
VNRRTAALDLPGEFPEPSRKSLEALAVQCLPACLVTLQMARESFDISKAQDLAMAGACAADVAAVIRVRCGAIVEGQQIDAAAAAYVSRLDEESR